MGARAETTQSMGTSCFIVNVLHAMVKKKKFDAAWDWGTL
jgi:hypothetical protein